MQTQTPSTKPIPTAIWLKDFCEAQGLSVKTARRLVGTRKIGHVRINGRIAFLPEQIEDYLKSNVVPPATTPRTNFDSVIKSAKEKLTSSK